MTDPAASFDALIAEGESVPVEGWDFSWFEGRATEERPPWGYARLLSRRLAGVDSALDLQTGGGEVLSEIEDPPGRLVATESWPPNLAVARRTLARLGASVVQVEDDSDLPFGGCSFDMVVSRHPTVTVWGEIGRVLRPGGSYLSQQVGAGSVRELTDFMMGPRPVSNARAVPAATAAAEAAGLDVVDVQEARLRMSFDDVGAVVHFLRKVIWTVPSFSVDRYRPRLAELHDRIRRDGPFVAHSTRYLIEAQKR